MSAQITQFASAGVDAIALTVAPTQTASAAAVAQAAGLDVPIVGSNPVFAPGLLQGPSAQWLKDHLYVASPITAWEAQPELLEQYEAAYPNTTPSLGAIFGYAMGDVMNQVLDAACESGDLTREGVAAAFGELSDVDTGGLLVPINAFETGVSPSTQSFVLRPADVPGGAEVVQDAFEGELATDLAG
jgi:ABC-type branched-subunit amino acid transport system substrate-binding protein